MVIISIFWRNRFDRGLKAERRLIKGAFGRGRVVAVSSHLGIVDAEVEREQHDERNSEPANKHQKPFASRFLAILLGEADHESRSDRDAKNSWQGHHVHGFTFLCTYRVAIAVVAGLNNPRKN
jgi:hypothetical protein